jgi:chemotaxis signal transduction protein
MTETDQNIDSQYLVLNIGAHYFAADVSHIEDVIKSRKTTAVPLSKGNIKGVLNLRGHIVTEVNVAKTLNIKEKNIEKNRHHYIVVINTEILLPCPTPLTKAGITLQKAYIVSQINYWCF